MLAHASAALRLNGTIVNYKVYYKCPYQSQAQIDMGCYLNTIAQFIEHD